MDLPIRKQNAICTERLVLAPYRAADVGALVELLTDPQVTATFMVPRFPSPADAAALAEKLIRFSAIDDTAHLEYGIYLDGALIGFVNDCGVEGDTIEIGYALLPCFWGQGYATEAVKAVIAALFSMGFSKVTAGYFVENERSRRVLERCGMHETDEHETIEYRGAAHPCRYCTIERT